MSCEHGFWHGQCDICEKENELHREIIALRAEVSRLGGENATLSDSLQRNAVAQTEHCKDCCCARSWDALGITSYTGKSIPEHITELRAELAAARAALQPICDAVNLTCAPECSLTEVIEAIAVSLPILSAPADEESER